MEEELGIIIREASDKINIANKKKDVIILKQALEPIQDALGELKEVIQDSIDLEKKDKQEQVYFDKDFNSKLIVALDKVFNLISKIKLPEQKPIDLSPINNIASEIKKQNESIIQLLNKPNQSDEVIRMLSAMVGKQNITFEKLVKEIDYSQKWDSLITAINNKTNDKVEKLTVIYQQGGTIKEVVPTYKK